MSTSRLEKFIYMICSMEVSDLPAPLSRIEILWNCLITGETPDFEPQSRNEQYLMAMLGLYELENLPTPMSRGEKLLYKIAMGETDLSDIPAYLSRYEELLGYLAENGGVGDFEYILQTLNQRLSTLYSTKERPMKQAVIKGDTLVNELPRPSLKNTMTNVASQKLNQGYDVVNTVDGEFKSAILKGQTIKGYKDNLFDGIIESGGLSINNGENDDRYPSRKRSANFIKVEPSTTITFARTSAPDGFHVVGYNANKEFVKGFANVMGANVSVGKINTTSDIYYVRFYDIAPASNPEYGVFQGDVQPGYTLLSVKMPVLTTTNGSANILTDSQLNDKTGEIESHNNSNKAIEDYILIPNNPVIVSNVTWLKISFYDANKVYISNTGGTNINKFELNDTTIPANAKYFRFHYNSANLPLIRFVNGTDYIKATIGSEPFKTNILSTSEDVVLRKVGDVQDTLDCLAGEVTERVGEVVLDGSEKWALGNSANWSEGDTVGFYFKFTDDEKTNIACSDKLPSLSNIKTNDVDCFYINDQQKWIGIRLSKSKLPNLTVEGLKEGYLKQNPLTVQYKLKTESTKTINPTITDQDGATQTKLHSFNDGHLSVSSQGLFPSVNYEVPTNNSYYLPDMLTLGAQYTSRGSADCNATIDGKLLALGTNRTFTTPSSLTNRLMVLDAPVDDLMFIKGDQTAKDFGYFEGMKSVVLSNKMPVLTTIGKNLFDGEFDLKISNTHAWSKNFIKVLPNTAYIFSHQGTDSGKKADRTEYYNEKFELIGYQGIKNEVITPNDCHYIKFRYHLMDKDLSKVENTQLEQGTVATTYEPYKSTTLTLNEPVTLRKVGDVQDTLDCLTGEVTERIGEVVLDGSEKWSKESTKDLTVVFKMTIYDMKNIVNNVALCEKLPVAIDGDVEKVTSKYNNLYLALLKSKASTVAELKSYLSQNPITVQYQLETESIKTVDSTTVDQDGQPTKLKTFNDISYVEINSNEIIPSVDVEVATKINETLATLDPQQLNISNTQNQLGQTIDEQTENTDATMMATTEIYEQTL